jgi:hypothetical protein
MIGSTKALRSLQFYMFYCYGDRNEEINLIDEGFKIALCKNA